MSKEISFLSQRKAESAYKLAEYAMRTARAALLVALTAVGLALLSLRAQADLLELKRADITYIRFHPNGRDPLVTQNGLLGRELGHGVELGLDFDIARYAYWNNRVHSKTDRIKGTSAGQFRSVGWHFEIGVRLTPQIDVFMHHHSRHILDRAGPHGYPVEDGIGFRLKLVQPSSRKSVFQ